MHRAWAHIHTITGAVLAFAVIAASLADGYTDMDIVRIAIGLGVGITTACSMRSRSEDEIFQRGLTIGEDRGYRAGRRTARPVVVPFTESERIAN